jgi:hypothetical protein
MKNLKLELFNFKRNLTIDESDLGFIIEGFVQNFEDYSEKELVQSLNERLLPHTWDNKVKNLLESFTEEIETQPLNYNLKHLFKTIDRKNHGQLYRPAMSSILDIINLQDDDSKMEAIMNELTMHDWIPEVKQFLQGYSNNPIEIQNYNNSGNGTKVYTLVEKVEAGHIAYIADRWFLIGENEIKQTLLEDHFTDKAKLQEFRILEKALSLSEIEGNKISFRIDENLVLSISTKNNKDIFLNEEKLDIETTLENLFDSKIIPWLKRDYYVLASTTAQNIDKFVDLDVALRVTNKMQPYLEATVFNYKDKLYIYSKDQRRGSAFYEYASPNDLIIDIQKDLDYDLTPFVENKLSKELKHLRALEDKEKKIEEKIKDCNSSIEMLKENEELVNEDEKLKQTFNNLLIYKHELYKNLNSIKEDKINAKRNIK